MDGLMGLKERVTPANIRVTSEVFATLFLGNQPLSSDLRFVPASHCPAAQVPRSSTRSPESRPNSFVSPSLIW